MRAAHAYLKFLVFIAAAASSAWADVELTTVIGREAVLQRDMAVPVWGTADPGAEVTVTFAGQSKTTQADAYGRWRVGLDPMPASHEGRPLVVTGPRNTITVDGLLVGEVFLYLSQSFHLDGKMLAAMSIDATVCPPISCRAADLWERNCHQRRPQSPVSTQPHNWQRFKMPGRYFRSDGFYFGYGLARGLGVPVGSMGHGASLLESMTPPEGFQICEQELGELAREVVTWMPTTKRGKEAYLEALDKMGRWVEKTESTLERKDITYADFRQPTALPGAPWVGRGPTTHYNAVVHACMPAAFRGIVIQAGGNNVGDPLYEARLKALILGLREVCGRPEIPVCVVQMHSPIRNDGEPKDINDWVHIREAQADVAALPNVTVIATYDLKNVQNNGPDRPLRVAAWAAALVSGSDVLTGPIHAGHETSGNTVTVTFRNVGRGLMSGAWADSAVAETEGVALKGFELSGADGIWHEAQAVIKGGVVDVTSDEVPAPVGVRYACRPSPGRANLYNRNGFPAIPFEAKE